jgi:hypothetical protein
MFEPRRPIFSIFNVVFFLRPWEEDYCWAIFLTEGCALSYKLVELYCEMGGLYPYFFAF